MSQWDGGWQGVEPPTVPLHPVTPPTDGPPRAVPEMFPTETVPTTGSSGSQAWSQVPDPVGGSAGPHTGLFPGWTGMHPAVPASGAGSALAPRPERRRRALYAVLGIAAVTAVVILAALLIAPHWGTGAANVADKDGRPTVSAPGTASTTGAVPTGSGSVGQTPGPTPRIGPTSTPSVAPPPAPVRTAAVRTVTVTATPTATAPGGQGAPRPTTAARSTPKPAPPKPTATKPAATTPSPEPAVQLGVPQRDIACQRGYIVQLASELDAKAFAARVSRLKAAGQVPAGSLAADTTHSCEIFTSQVNAVVLYSGPYSDRYAGCAARLAGPADAYIKGSNPDTAHDYVSCLCPTQTSSLPRYSRIGEQGVWIGEAQRVLGSRLDISVGDVSGRWGILTPGTRAAVQKFQRSAKLPADGALDARTWKALQTAEC